MEKPAHSQIDRRLLHKADLISLGDDRHKRIRTLLFMPGGGMRGAGGAGFICGLHALGLDDAFDVVGGTSTGAALAANFLSGSETTRLTPSIYHTDLPGKLFRLFENPPAKIDHVEHVMRTGEKRARTEVIRASRSEFFVGVTCMEDFSFELLDAKSAFPDPIAAVKASMAIPGMYNQPVRVNRRFFVDGSIQPLPIREMIAKYQPTDILVIANATEAKARSHKPSLGERLTSPYFLRHVPSELRRKWAQRYEAWQESLHEFRSLKDIHTGILWSPDSLHMFDANPEKLRRASVNAFQQTFRSFGKPIPEVTFL